MNKGIYHLVFNKARGLLLVAGELASNGGKNTSVKTAKRIKKYTGVCHSLALKLRPLSFSFLLLSGCLQINAVQAQIITDSSAPANQQATVTASANGTPQVNIQTPSAAGVSHNTYTQFDVNQQGVILNNATGTVQTQQAGLVAANQNLVNGSASIILNEVNSLNQSQLNGFVEVAGTRADVVIANPAGITCSGCGFINTRQATLTTGLPQVTNGALSGYQVQQGQVSIGANGMDASSTDYTQIIARSVQVNGALVANNLNVVAGTNQVDEQGDVENTILSNPVSGLAIDVAALGGMYAGQIRLIGTEEGVGVRNAGEIGASAGNLSITADGQLINEGSITAAMTTDITIGTDVNNSSVIHSANNTQVHAEGVLSNTGSISSEVETELAAATLDNEGLINGATTELAANQLNNQGSGRIYGDTVTITADTLTNSVDGEGRAAVIAARDEMQIGVRVLNNEFGSLIHSGGDIAIGGDIVNGAVTDFAEQITNASAYIESDANLLLQANTIDNLNTNFEVEEETITETISEYSGLGSTDRYTRDQVSFSYQDRATYLWAGGVRYVNWSHYQYTRTETRYNVVNSDPAHISAAGDITVEAQNLTNDRSQIVAGGTLNNNAIVTENTEGVYNQVTTDSGRVTHARRDRYCATRRHGRCIDRDYETDYHPRAYNNTQSEPVDLSATQLAGDVTSITSSLNSSSIPLSINNSLFIENPSPTATYLIETDPQFTNQSQWLSSGYLLSQFGISEMTQKRLGDGFYEQRLVREQMVDLTGKRYLAGFDNDEEQYQALMDNGIAFAQQFDLMPGVSLSEELLLQLTTDIVWLETETVTLRDGSTQDVLVPKVYALVQEGDLLGEGSLLSGKHVNLNNNQLVNSGKIIGSQSVSIEGVEINDQGGHVQANTITATVTEDIQLQGSQWRARDEMSLSAGRDIHLDREVLTETSTQGTRTKAGQQTSLLVTGAGSSGDRARDRGTHGNSTLSVNADRNITVTASKIDNQGTGDTTLQAGESLTLDSITVGEAYADDVSQSSKQNVIGSKLSGQGDVSLSAGTQLSAEAASINAGNDLTINAETINLSAGQNTDNMNYRVHGEKAESRSVKHLATELTGGNNISLNASDDLTLQGANATAGNDISLNAGGDLTVSAVQDETYRVQQNKKKGTFGRSEIKISERFQTTSVGGELTAGAGDAASGNLQINSQITPDGSITTNNNSGDVSLKGATLTAADNVVVSGEKVSVIALKDIDYSRTETRKKGFGGLSSSRKGSMTREQLLQSSEITALAQDLSLLSDSDIVIMGSEVISGGEINLTAVDDIIISADQIISESKTWSQESRFNPVSTSTIYEREDHIAGDGSARAQASTLSAQGNINLDASRIKIIGSDVESGENINATTDVGDIEILSAQEAINRYSKDTTANVTMEDVVEQLVEEVEYMLDVNSRVQEIGTDDEQTQATLTLSKAEYHQVDSKTQITDNRESTLIADGNINLNAAGDITVQGSDLIADSNQNEAGDLTLQAGGDVEIVESSSASETQTKELHGTGELSVVVQHQAVEIVQAVKAVEEAKDALKDAKEDYRQYKKDLKQLKRERDQLQAEYENKVPGILYEDIVELNDLIDDVESDEEWYQGSILMAAANLTSKITLLTQQVAAGAASTATWGFNAGIQLDLDATKIESEKHNESSRGSTLSGNNIVIRTGNGTEVDGTSTLIRGSHLNANNNIDIATGDLNIEASRDNHKNVTNTDNAHIRIAQTLYGAAGGPTISVDYTRTRAKDGSTTFNNSTLNAQNISLSSSNDTTIKGANVHAGDGLNVDVGGDLLVQSMQNRYSGENKNLGLSAGFGTSNGQVSSVNAGLQTGNGRTRSKETELTSLTGNTVNIHVEGHTGQVGSLIAATDEEGSDTGNLSLNTHSYDFVDLSNTHFSNQRSAGISTNIGLAEANTSADPNAQTPSSSNDNPVGIDFTEAHENGTAAPGKTKLTYTNESSYGKTKSLATLGNGSITIRDDKENGTDSTERLNRDLDNTEKEFYDVKQPTIALEANINNEDIVKAANVVKQTAEYIASTVAVSIKKTQLAMEAQATTEAISNLRSNDATTRQDSMEYLISQTMTDDGSEGFEHLKKSMLDKAAESPEAAQELMDAYLAAMQPDQPEGVQAFGASTKTTAIREFLVLLGLAPKTSEDNPAQTEEQLFASGSYDFSSSNTVQAPPRIDVSTLTQAQIENSLQLNQAYTLENGQVIVRTENGIWTTYEGNTFLQSYEILDGDALADQIASGYGAGSQPDTIGNTYGDQLPEALPTSTAGNQIADQQPTDTAGEIVELDVGNGTYVNPGETLQSPTAYYSESAEDDPDNNPAVRADAEIDGVKYTDTNQTSRPPELADPNTPTLINDRIEVKLTQNPDKFIPNGNMATAHAEIGAIQQAYDAGMTQGRTMTMTVTGKDVCGYCVGDVAAAAEKAGLKRLKIKAFDDDTGLPKTYYWEAGFRSLKELD